MIDLRRTPSIQHTVALMSPDVETVMRNLEKLEAAQINISLQAGRRLIKPLMEGKPLAWALGQCALEKTEANRAANADFVRGFEPYARNKAVSWFRTYPKDVYPIGGGIVIPLNPPGFWAADGRLQLLWVQAWKGRTLDPLQRAILYTILDQRVFQGDFKDAEFNWVDLREPKRGAGRQIETLARKDFTTVTERELTGYLEVLRTAFDSYSADRKRRREEERAKRPPPPSPLFPDLDG